MSGCVSPRTAERSTTATVGYSAVVTTGIYCRPGCPASPQPANVVAYSHPAAAEAAGFRACHRCRPYREPSSDPWTSGPELVCRAVRLVVDGALDGGGTEAGLAHRLGVSARHLRRLFTEHVGTTPDQVARSRRAHFARRLLDDTDLPITQIAFAAGFGSVRQMNRQVQTTFRATPGELRARRRRTDRLVADGGLELRLPVRSPYEWRPLLEFLAARAVPGVEAVDVASGSYRRTIVVHDHPGVVEVLGDDDPGQLRLRVHLPYWDGLIHVVDRARAALDIDTDPSAVLAALGRDPLVGPAVRARPGMRVPGVWEPWEACLRAVLGQQVSVRRATALVGHVASQLGTAVPGLDAMGLGRTLPTAEAVAAAGVDGLAGLGVPHARRRALAGLAEAVASGDVDLDGGRPLAELVDQMCSVDGIGPWTAHYVALRLGEPDAFPAGDLGVRRALAQPGTPPPSAAEAERRAEAWRPWRAHAAVRLWAAA